MTFVVGVVVTIPRLRVHGPSLIDDWTEIRYGPLAWHQLSNFGFDPATYDPGRFRPAFWGIWGQLQWHTLGAPHSMVGPNFWNYVRLLLFAAAVAGAVVAALEWSGRRFGTGWTAILAAVPGVLVLGTPQFGVDFQRFGPQEPLLFGGLAGGLLILLLVARGLTAGRPRRGVLLVALALVGTLLYLFGVYMKEASICLLVLIPFLPYGRLRTIWRATSAAGRAGLVALVLIVVLPLLHMVLEVLDLYGKPQLVYGAQKPHGLGGTISRLFTIAWDQWRGVGSLTGTPLWQVLIVGITVLVAIEAFRARSLRRLDVALVVLAWALFVFQGFTAALETRYFIPVVALFGIVAVLLIADRRPKVQQWAVAVAAVIVLVHIPSSGNGTFGFANNDAQSLRYVDAVARLHPERCAVFRSRMDIEARAAVPEVLALRPAPGSGCEPGYAAVLVQGTDFLKETFDKQADAAVERACSGGWKQIRKIDRAIIYGCRRLRVQPPPQSRMKPESSPTAPVPA